jgi:hypothetical protein
VWIAISVYVLVAIVKKEHKLERSMTEILQILSLNLFEKTPLFSTLSRKTASNGPGSSLGNNPVHFRRRIGLSLSCLFPPNW